MGANALNELLARYPADVKTLALGARSYILEWMPRAEETVDTTAPVIGYGYAPATRV